MAAHADAIRKRLNELHEELKVDFPVYAVFTKMDLVVGFTEYFADLDETKRQVVWGATFQTAAKADKKANKVGKVPEEIDLLIQRIADRMPERLQEEPDLRSRAILFGFPAQLGALRKPIARFPQPHLRADPLPDDGDPARLLFHLRHAGGHAVRRADRRAAEELRGRELRRRRLFRGRARATSCTT